MQYTEAQGAIPLTEEANPETPEAEQAEDVETSNPNAEPVEAHDGEPEPDSEEVKAEKAKKREGYRARARTSRIEKENRELREQIERQKAEREAPALKEPNRDDYTDYEQYLEARAEYRAEQIVTAKQQEIEAKQAEREQRRQIGEIESRWEDAQDQARDKYEDFDDVVYGDVSFSDPMAMAIKETGNADVAYYLGKNQKESDRIAKLSPVHQVMELGAIGERLKERPIAKPPPKPVTRGRTSQTTASNALNDNMSTEEWVKARNKQLGR